MKLFLSKLSNEDLLAKNGFNTNLEHWTQKDLVEQVTDLNNRSIDGKKIYFHWRSDLLIYDDN